MLVFELTPDHEELEIHCDKIGLMELKQQLEYLLAGRGHAHLMTPAWAGHELTEEAQNEEHKVLNHVKIVCWQK